MGSDGIAIIDTLTDGGYARRMDCTAEKALIERSLAGEDEAFTLLVHRHAARVVGLATRLLADRAEAEDLAQEAFLRLHRALPDFRGESSIATWLYRTTTRLAIDHLRRENLKRRIFFLRRGDEADDLIEQVADHRRGPDGELQDRQAMRRLRRALGLLSPRQRAVFVLRHHEGLPLADIAKLLDLETGTVKSHLHRAVTLLRQELAETCEALP